MALVQRACGQWRNLEQRIGQNLLEITGGLWMGALDSPVVAGARRSAKRHGLQHELLAADEIRRRYPAFLVDDHVWGLLEPNAGILRPEECVRAQLNEAERHGAQLQFGQRMLRWSADGEGVRVETNELSFTAGPTGDYCRTVGSQSAGRCGTSDGGSSGPVRALRARFAPGLRRVAALAD